MRPTTFECLLAHFAGNPMLTIDVVAQYLNIDTETLVEKIRKRKVGLTYFRPTDGQKGKKFVMVADLADHIDERHKQAVEELTKSA